MSYLQELIDDGYTDVVVIGNPEVRDELNIVARGEPAYILASEQGIIEQTMFVDGIQKGGRIAFLDNPTEKQLIALRDVSRNT